MKTQLSLTPSIVLPLSTSLTFWPDGFLQGPECFSQNQITSLIQYSYQINQAPTQPFEMQLQKRDLTNISCILASTGQNNVSTSAIIPSFGSGLLSSE